MAQVEVVYYVIEYLANYWLVGLLWGGFLRLRYAPARNGFTLANWLMIILYWPIMMLVFIQGCIFGAGSK